MSRGGKRHEGEKAQGDLFAGGGEKALYPVRRKETGMLPVDLSLRIKTLMGTALKEAPDSAGVVAAKMSEIMLGRGIDLCLGRRMLRIGGVRQVENAPGTAEVEIRMLLALRHRRLASPLG
jgi:hypothetical protein